MELIVNDNESNLAEGLTVRQLLIEQKVKMPEMVSVECLRKDREVDSDAQ